MAFDKGLAQRIEDYFASQDALPGDIRTKRMFGGLCFLKRGNMCCGIVDDKLMARVGPEQYQSGLQRPHAVEMDFTGRPLKGMVYVLPSGTMDDSELTSWLQTCERFVDLLPPK